MAIYGRGYRRLVYTPTAALARIWPISKHEFKTIFRLRLGVVLYIVCLGPTIAYLFVLLMRSGLWQTEPRETMVPRDATGRGPRPPPFSEQFDPATPWFYLWPILTASFVPFLILTTLVSVRAIAKDRAAGALEIYWTRAISPLGYFLGKWLGSFLLLGSAFVVAPAVLWLTSVVLAPDWHQLEVTIGLIPRVLVGFTLLSAAMSLLAVGVSALAATANFASILWLFLVVGTLALGQVLRFGLRMNWLGAINPWHASKRIVESIVGVAPYHDFSPATAVATLGTTLAVVLAMAARRLRVLEAVAT